MAIVRRALKPGSAPTVEDWPMTADGIRARELITGKLFYLRFTSQNTAGLVLGNLSIAAKLGLDVYGGRIQGPLLLYSWRSRMLAMLRALHSFLADTPKRTRAECRSAGHSTKTAAQAIAPRIAIVALVVSDHDRDVLTRISDREPVDIHFAESHVDAWEAMNRLNSPVILYDRDWPDAEWRTTVQALASSPHRSCVILASRVADDYLWQELIRCGGYDLLAKPFRADDVARALKLALSYWKSARAAATQ
jgi:hypothetical protein